MNRRIGQLYRLLSFPARAGVLVTIALLVAERLVLAAGALGLAGQLAITWASSAGVVALWALRGLVRQRVTREARAKITMVIAEAALDRGADGSFLPGEEADAAVFEGRFAAEQVIVRHLPALVAEPAAAIVLAAIIRPAGVPLFVGVAAIGVAALLLVALRNLTVTRQRGAWRKYMDVARDTLTSVRAATEIIASGHERTHLERLRASVDDWTMTAARAERNAALFQRIPFAAIIAVAVVLIVKTQTLELAQLLRLAIFLPPLAGLMRTIFDLVRTAPRIHTLGAALDARPGANETRPPKLPPPEMPCEIRFESVSFAYAGVPVLKDVSFVWKPGEVLGIQGPNGSGKSTLLRLMLGLLQPTEGRILAGGLDLREIDLPAWRRKIAYLPQRPYVPEKCTVIEAMRLTVPDLGEIEARRGLESMDVWERIERRRSPQLAPLHTPMATLSAGMRQRIFLAKTRTPGSSVVALDEPDENLDQTTVEKLQGSFECAGASQMIAVATHNAALLQRTSHIVKVGGC